MPSSRTNRERHWHQYDKGARANFTEQGATNASALETTTWNDGAAYAESSNQQSIALNTSPTAAPTASARPRGARRPRGRLVSSERPEQATQDQHHGSSASKRETDRAAAEALEAYCKDMLSLLDGDAELCKTAAAGLRGCIWNLSRHKSGTRVVQKALDKAQKFFMEELLVELHGCVREAIECPNANYVIQKVIEVLPVARAAFVAEEMTGIAVTVAQHQKGCRVLVRLLEHSPSERGTLVLLEEIFAAAPRLVRHSYGRYVMQAILEHSPEPSHQHYIAAALLGGGKEDILANALNRHGSGVIETALSHCAPSDVQAMCSHLLSTEDNILQLAKGQFGHFVLKALLELPGVHVEPTLQLLQTHVAELPKHYNSGKSTVLDVVKISK